MATLLNSESRRLYSWWWDSHISPKNSKWLQENLTDMDGKVKSMIKLIEEDADSFARRAEMYYKKRPELMKLVEEFYRAYRALAERYNHATGELRHAHRTIAKAFPNQAPPLDLIQDSPSKSDYRETKFPVCTLFDGDDYLDDDDDDDDGTMCKTTTPSIEDFQLSNKKNQKFKEKVPEEREIADLKEVLADVRAEKEESLLNYQRCLEKLSNVEGELNNAQRDSMRLNEKASRAEIEIQTLKEALIQLEAEKDSGLVKHKEYLEKISTLQDMVSQVQEKADIEAQTLKEEISRLELEKESAVHQYKQCLGKISVLENVISVTENDARLFKNQAERAEDEVSELKKSLANLNKEKEASAIQYKCCLETIAKLEREILSAREEVEHLNKDVLVGIVKLKNAEEKCDLLEMSNLSLRTEAENLVKKIAAKDRELSEKQEELENLETRLEDEKLRYSKIEASLKTLQNLHSQSQDDQRALAMELENVMKGLEVTKHGLEEEIRQLKDENSSSSVSKESMQNEILSLKGIKERLEKEVSHHVGLSNSLQQEISCLKEEIAGLNMSYQALAEQVEAAGLNPKCVGSSIKRLQDENSKLREIYEQGSNEREILSNKMENMEKEKAVLESESREKMKALQESCLSLDGEKSTLVAEKASLLSQLQAITETMLKLLEKNAVLENSMSTARVELEGLREKSKGLEEICELLKGERSFLLTEKGSLAFKLEIIERRLETLEKRYLGLEEKYGELKKEKEAVHCQVEELKLSLSVEKKERTISDLKSVTNLAGLENQIHLLREENRLKKKEFEQEFDRSLKAQLEISILQKFIKDMEEKNRVLIIECQKHVEASKLAEKLISELESESLEQQVEGELLSDEIERLRLGIHKVFKALETVRDPSFEDGGIENEKIIVQRIVGAIEGMKGSVSKHEDDKQLLLVENSVLLTLLEELESKGMEMKLKNIYLEKEFKAMAEKLLIAENDKVKLLDLNIKLKSDVFESHQKNSILEGELEGLCETQVDLRKVFDSLQEVYLQVSLDNKDLLKRFSDLKEEKYKVDQHNDDALMEWLATANQSVILRSFLEEKIGVVKLLLEDLNRQNEVNTGLEKEMNTFKDENLVLKDGVHKLEKEIQATKKEIVSGKEILLHTEENLLDKEMKLEAAENLNIELYTTVGEMMIDFQESLQIKENLEKDVLLLSENNSMQKKEIEGLHLVNTKLESEIRLLREELQEKIIKEKNDFEMWEAEAGALYFDLHISSINEVLFGDKVKELTGMYRSLENENASKTSEIEQMKGNFFSMEREIRGLKSQLYAYAPVVDALRDDITLLEENAILQTKRKESAKSANQEQEFLEAASDPRRSISEILPEDQSLISLQNLLTRIRAVGKMMEETNKPIVKQRRSKSNGKQLPATGEEEREIHRSKPRRFLGRDKQDRHRKKGNEEELVDSPKLHKIKTKKGSQIQKHGMMMKDIPLDHVSNSEILKKKGNNINDQMLELWETSEDGNRELTIGDSLRLSYKMTEKDIVYNQFESIKGSKSGPPSIDSDMERQLVVDKLAGPSPTRSAIEPNREALNARRILERLTSDAHKLENLQITVENLKMKLETTKKGRKRKAKSVDLETVQEQLLEAEETVGQLVNLNGQLVKSIGECPSPDGSSSPRVKETTKIRRRKVVDQARKGSERISRLQLELQKIQYILLKHEDEKKNKVRGKFFGGKTVILRDFIYSGGRKIGGRRKTPLCGCFRSSSSKSGSSN